MEPCSLEQSCGREFRITVEDLVELRNSGYNLDQVVDGKTLLMTAVCKVNYCFLALLSYSDLALLS